MVDSVFHADTGERPPQTHIDNGSAVIGRKTDTIGDIGKSTASGAAENLDRHDASPECYPGHALAVVGRLGDGPGNVGSVALVVARFHPFVHEVITGNEGSLVEIFHLMEVLKILVSHAGVNNSRDHVTTGGCRPSALNIDHFHVPLFMEARVVGEIPIGHLHRHTGETINIVGVAGLHPGIALQLLQEGRHLRLVQSGNQSVVTLPEIGTEAKLHVPFLGKPGQPAAIEFIDKIDINLTDDSLNARGPFTDSIRVGQSVEFRTGTRLRQSGALGPIVCKHHGRDGQEADANDAQSASLALKYFQLNPPKRL